MFRDLAVELKGWISSRSERKKTRKDKSKDKGKGMMEPLKQGRGSFGWREEVVNVDVDEVLRTKKIKVEDDGKIVLDELNSMDNWFLSSKKLIGQKGSEDLVEKGKWEKRRELGFGVLREDESGGRWIYGKSERWFDCGDGLKFCQTNGVWEGEKEFSGLFWDLWGRGDEGESVFFEMARRRYGIDGVIHEFILWKMFRCLISELLNEDQMSEKIPDHRRSEPNTIWNVGKIMFLLLTHSQFWDKGGNAISPIENGHKFGVYKQDLQRTYSKTLFKYILGCLSHLEVERFTKPTLLSQFEKVFSVYSGTYIPEEIDETLDDPYIPTNPLIPTGLTKSEGLVYEALLQILAIRKTANAPPTPHVITITDLAKDYDDLMAMIILKELHRLGLIVLEGFIANLSPAPKRALFGRGALDSLNLQNIPIGIGSVGDPVINHKEQPHEFAHTESFIAPPTTQLPSGQDLLKTLFANASTTAPTQKLTLLTISSLLDIAQFTTSNPTLLSSNLSHVVMQGGYSLPSGVLTPDPLSANNKFSLPSSQSFHTFLQTQHIPSTVYTKVAANALSLSSSLFSSLAETSHPLGIYLRNVQLAQDMEFYIRACSPIPKDRFQIWMDQDWYIKYKSTFFLAGHEPDEPYPEGNDIIPYFSKIIAYDALAAVGTAGEDVLREFGLEGRIRERVDTIDPEGIHGIVGVLPDGKRGFGEEVNFDVGGMERIVSALTRGSVFAVVQGL